MGLDGLFGEKQPLTDLAIDETVGDKLQHFDLSRRGFLLELSKGRRCERDHRSRAAGAAPRGGRLETATVVAVAAQYLLALSSVHAPGIGRPGVPL